MIDIARAMRESFANAEEPFRKWVADSGRPVSCGKGCSACCELIALITWPEAALLAEDLRARRLVAEFAPRLLAQAKACCFEGVDQRSYFDRRIPCAFLEPEKTCAMYAARPAPCRYHVVFSPPALCGDRTPGTDILQTDESEPLKRVVLPIVAEIVRQAGPEAYVAAPIPIMVLAALQQLGEEVEPPISPGAWLDLYGERVWKYQHAKRKRPAP